MTEKRYTYVKMADGTIAPVEYRLDPSEQSEEARKLAESARKAGQAAIRDLLSKGIPVVFLKGKNLIRHYPDGHEEIIKENIIP